MNKIYFKINILLLLFLLSLPAIAQRGVIKGIVKDTTSYPRVANATALIIGATDSVMQSFTRTRKDGSFTLTNIPYGKYILVISHPNYGDYAEEISISDSIKFISRDYYLVQKSILINEVIIQRQRDVRISGDTTEFNVKNYKLLENASAEDLLKLLPGIKVDKNGKITAYGEAVNKVYVDGEEFFSDDPTIATKNIKAEMIDKVQVYDKKTDQETLTGVDDGSKNTVINLKLKDEFKKGFFGKINAGAGLPGTLDNGVMINVFNDKRKISGYVTQSNIGNNSLGWNEQQKYGSGSDYTMSDDGYYYTYYSSDDNILSGSEGTSNSINGGANYNDKFLKNKLGLNSSYTFNSGNRDILKTTNTRQTVNDSTYFQNENENYKASLLSQKGVARLIYDLDSNNKITYSVNATIKNIKLKGGYYSETFNSKMDSVNNSTRTIDQNENSNTFNQELLLGHKFKHKGRTLSLNASLNLTDNNKLKFIDTKQKYYNEGILLRTDTLNQKNENQLTNQVASVKVSYTESLGKKWLLEVHYKPTFATNKSAISSTVKDFNGEYNNKVDTLSNSFVYNTSRHEGGVSLKYYVKKLNVSVTLNDEVGELKRIDLINSINNSNYNYNALNPSMQMSYTFKNNMNLRLRYNGSNKQPQINQLQPIKDYTNPLNVNIGNPKLKPSYGHSMSAFIHKYSIQHSKYYYISVNYNLDQNAFTQQSTFSKEGVTKYFTINGDNMSSASLWSQMGRNIIKDLVRASLDYSFSSSNNNGIINDIKNISNNIQNQVGCDLSYTKEKVLEISVGYRISYGINTNKGTLTTQTNIVGHSIEAGANLNLLKHFVINADYSFNKNKSNSPTARPYEIQMLNASAGYKFLNKKAELSLMAHNILNQNNGYSIYQSSTSITRSQSNVLGRYFMISFTYNFSNKGSNKKDEEDDDY